MGCFDFRLLKVELNKEIGRFQCSIICDNFPAEISLMLNVVVLEKTSKHSFEHEK